MDSIMARTEGFQPVCKTSISKFHAQKRKKWETVGGLKPQKTQTPLKVLFGAKYIFHLPHEMLFAGRF